MSLIPPYVRVEASAPPHPLLSPAQPPAVSALCTFGRALPPTNAHSSLVPPSAQDADGREVQEAVPNSQGA